jgi:hypothetical protein
MKEPDQSLRIEPRWPVALTVLALLLLLTALPGRVRILPIWVPDVLGSALIVPIAAITLATKKARWLRIERAITLLFFIVVEGATLVNLTQLITAMVDQSGKINGIQLLTSSIAMWVINVFTFSLLYWQIDRGGPEARSNNVNARPDWLFPQEGAREDVPPDWRPTFVDYLFLGYSTATAFSATR